MVKMAMSMALTSNSPSLSPSSSSSSSSPSIMCLTSPVFIPNGLIFGPKNCPEESSANKRYPLENPALESPVSASGGLIFASSEEQQQVNRCYKKYKQENLCFASQDFFSEGLSFMRKEHLQENLSSVKHPQMNSHSRPHSFNPKCLYFTSKDHSTENFGCVTCSKDKLGVSMPEGLNSPATRKVGDIKLSSKARKRPARIVIPESYPVKGVEEMNRDFGENEVVVEGRDFYLASKRGRREVMEDAYGAITNISGDSQQAFFGVFDGHGGRAAVDFVAEKLGNNIIRAIEELEKEDNKVEQAIRAGYMATDEEFLRQGVSSGACAATVVLKNGELHVANVGDCRVVLSRKGVADALTCDHRVEREDERFRIEHSGGYVNCFKGVWRVQGSLAVSRAIGDSHMKEWIISEPETNKLRLTSDCEFLIMASDGLWDKVTNQEAVDVVLSHKNYIESCKKLVDISSKRGNRDDITVMVVDLQKFAQMAG